MFGDMMGKLQEMKQKAEETKARLKTISVEGESPDNSVKVTANGVREITDIQIDEKLLEDKEQLQDMVLLAVNRTLEKAEKIYESEMQGVAKGILPNIPGLGL